LSCYLGYKHSQTCPPGENVCFVKTWCDGFCNTRGERIIMGCAATCPTAKSGVHIACCSTDNCNIYAKWGS
uniref:Alpha-elapitoxin-Ast2a n=1 Tax=Hydrophis stokesii TaxID=355677 RepID=3L21_HYDST|nr:RecName: Full=Alpha-elapitoxin-Ast2a; Short=Alpha-EPTX-Ast2a; AltName: Full=Long neurotoxin 1; AltName: Full=Toxin B [Hydrophis stokesii]